MTVASASPHRGPTAWEPSRQPARHGVHRRPDRPGLLGRVADVAARRRGLVFIAWLAAVAVAVLASSAFAGKFDADYSAPGSDSQVAAQLLSERFPAVSGEGVDLVVHAADGIRQARVQNAVRTTVQQLSAVPHVRAVSDPYSTPGAVAPDGRTLMVHVQLDVALPTDMPVADVEALIAAADRLPSAAGPGVRSAVGGQVIQQAEQGAIGSEGIGLAAAALILLLTFGSVVAAGLPILVAVTGLGVSSAGVGLLAALTDVPDWSTSLAAMMGIGVGIDYVLLLVTRYREFLADGLEPRRAIVAMADTAGRAVLVAGTTVVISLLGLAAMSLSFMTGAALATILAVLVVMMAAITLLPALLSVVGSRIDRLRLPLPRRARNATRPSGWARWSRTVQRRPRLTAASGLVVLAILAAPFLGVRFGFPDASNDAPTLSSRQAYDMVSDGFGVGANGPLVLVAELPRGGDVAGLHRLRERVASTPGVASVTAVVPNTAGDTAVMTVSPTTGPQSKETEDLVHRLRESVIPSWTRGTGVTVHVGGVTPAAIDSTDNVVRRLPALVVGVVGLSFLLLMTVFRSVAIAVKAAVVNLLSLGAAYGVVAYALDGGWFGRLFGIATATPMPAFIPVLMFAVLFGLSMDYEVFLLSRIRERWLATGDRSASVTEGLTSTAGVITAAAAIMVAVFAAFIPSSEVTLKVIGIGMATAILVDATVVRMVLVPAVMQLLGRATWWLPRWLDRLLPELHVEGHAEAYLRPALASAGAPPLPRIDRTSS